MLNHKRPRPFLVILLSLLVVSLWAHPFQAFSQNPEEHPGSPADRYPFLSILSEGDQVLRIQFSPPAVEVDQTRVADQPCQAVLMHGLENHLTAENLFLPVQGALIGIPPDARPSLHIITAEYDLLPGPFTLCPLEKPVAESIHLDDPAFDILPTGFWQYGSITGFTPFEVVDLVETGYIRDQRFAQIRLNPVQYNPASGELRAYTSIQVEVQFNAGTAPTINTRSQAADVHFDHILSDVLLNPAQAQPWRSAPPPASTPAAVQYEMDSTYKIAIAQDGIYKISYTDLLDAGIPAETLGLIDPRSFQIFNHAVEISIQVVGEDDGSFDPGDYLLFFGEKTNTRYTDINIYWLTWAETQGLRMATLNVLPGGSAPVPLDYTAVKHLEQDLMYSSSHPSGDENDRWYWGRIISSGDPRSEHFGFELEGLSGMPTTVTLQGLLKGDSANQLHRARIYINDTANLVADLTFPSGSQHTFSASFPASYLVEGPNTIIVEANPNGTSSWDIILINRFELVYGRNFSAHADTINFSATGHWEYRVNGFSTDDIIAYDLTLPAHPVRLTGYVVETTPEGYQVRFENETVQPQNYHLAGGNQFLSPQSISPARQTNLRSNPTGADYIIITHHTFIEDVQPLADFRASQGYRTLVVDVADIYDEFNSGIFSPEAIRDFLAYAYAHWQPPAPSFVLLVGDGHYDFKNNLGYGETNFIPPYLVDVDSIMGETAADNRYVSVSGEDILPDMYIGRFPVRTSAEAQVMVEKTIQYETAPPAGDWTTNLTYIADNPDTAGNFPAESERIISFVTPDYTVERIYLGAPHNKESAQAEIKNAFNTGRLLIHYTGHGSVTLWAAEKLLQLSDLPALANQDKLPFILAMTCLEGNFYHHNPPDKNHSSLAESIVRMSGGGAVGTWSPTGYGMTVGHMILAEHLADNLFTHNQNQIGYLTNQAKYHLYGTTSAFRDLIDNYIVFGDPALRLNIPSGLSKDHLYFPLFITSIE